VITWLLLLASKRNYSQVVGNGILEVDPRFLLFEYCHGLMFDFQLLFRASWPSRRFLHSCWSRVKMIFADKLKELRTIKRVFALHNQCSDSYYFIFSWDMSSTNDYY
jgi:hypothetical protein